MIDKLIADMEPTYFVCPLCGERVEMNCGPLKKFTAVEPYVHTCEDGNAVELCLIGEGNSGKIHFTAKFCKAGYCGYAERDLSFVAGALETPELEFATQIFRMDPSCTEECEKYKKCQFKETFKPFATYQFEPLSRLELKFKLGFDKGEYVRNWRDWNVKKGQEPEGQYLARFRPLEIFNSRKGTWDKWEGGYIELFGSDTSLHWYVVTPLKVRIRHERLLEEADYNLNDSDVPMDTEAHLCPVFSEFIDVREDVFQEGSAKYPVLEFKMRKFFSFPKCKKCGFATSCKMKTNVRDCFEIKNGLFATYVSFKVLVDKEDFSKAFKNLFLTLV